MRTAAHRGAPRRTPHVYYIHYGSHQPNRLLVLGCREKENCPTLHCPTLHCPTPNGTIVPTELSPPMRSALRRVADARVPYGPFKCNLEMSGKTGNGWASGIRVSSTCAAKRNNLVTTLLTNAPRCAALRRVAPRCAKRNNLVTTLLTKPIYYFSFLTPPRCRPCAFRCRSPSPCRP